MPSRHRIFIAIALPENVKKKLFEFRDRFYDLPVRWTKKDSLHLTLVFIGDATEEELYEACKMTRQIAEKHEPFDINFEKILYGPPALRQAQGVTPRMIWLEGKKSEKASAIKKELEDVLMESDKIAAFRPERRPFSPHITLARFKMGQAHDLEELPQINEDFRVGISVASIEVMESDLKGDGAEYVILESCPLGG